MSPPKKGDEATTKGGDECHDHRRTRMQLSQEENDATLIRGEGCHHHIGGEECHHYRKGVTIMRGDVPYHVEGQPGK